MPRIAAVLTSMVLLALALVAPARATFPGENGRIVFSALVHHPGVSNFHIYSVNSDGTDLRDLTCCGEYSAWSPDGQRLAFQNRESAARRYIYVMNADGSGARKLTVAPAHTVPLNEYDPAWSRDGSKLAYEQGPLASAGQDNSTDIAVVNADGTNAHDLTNTPGEYELWPKWSPVADIIAFTTSEGIWTMRSDGTDRKLIAGSADHGPTSWSPDGRRLLFTRGGQIWAMNGDGTGQAPIGITPLPPPHSCCPTWSPDGRRILFDSGDGLYVANRDGSDSSLITGPGPSAPDWQPIPGPKRSDYKNAAQFCKADQAFLGDAAFLKKYGTNPDGANAFGKCVSQTH